jgi:hypothetical protein
MLVIDVRVAFTVIYGASVPALFRLAARPFMTLAIALVSSRE